MKTKLNTKVALRFSRFCHILPRQDKQYVLFHSLNMEIVFLVSGFSSLIDSFNIGKSVDSIIQQMNWSENERKIFIKLINQLIKFKMLVPVKYEENEEIGKYCAENLPGPAINLMYLILTDECNFECTYCFVENAIPNDYKYSYMSFEMAKERIDKFAIWSSKTNSKNKSILFYGGEPLLNKDVFMKSVLYINKLKLENVLQKNTDISIITNGSLITKEIANFIYKNKIKVGLSVDGNPECNDSCRKFTNGNGTFQSILKGYNYLMESGITEVGISLTVGYHNIDSLLEQTKYIIDKFSVKSLGYNILMDSENNIIVTKEYTKKVSDEIINCFKYLRERGIYEDRVMRKVEFFTNKKIYPNDCAACGRQFVALPSGEIGPCQAFIGSKKFFSKNNNTFSPIESNIFKEWSKRSPLSMPQCYDCIALGLCGGGCPCRAYIRNGDIWALDEIFCSHSKKTVNWIIDDYAKLNSI
ncbi:MAG: radical SAM protein [Bacteroidetes bacterium]|nr:radical SAM protein [Bacteroidota bacterium]